jgi:hypothetical protein
MASMARASSSSSAAARFSRRWVSFAAWVPGAELAGLPELAVVGLQDEDARALLESALAGPLDARVRDLIVAETRGNPLALLELPRGLSPAELAGGFGLPDAGPLPGLIEDSFRRQLKGAAMILAAWQGRDQKAFELIQATIQEATPRGQLHRVLPGDPDAVPPR